MLSTLLPSRQHTIPSKKYLINHKNFPPLAFTFFYCIIIHIEKHLINKHIMKSKLLNEKINIVSISKIESLKECKIPFPEHSVPAGFPSPAENFTENVLDLNDLLIKHTASTFFVRVVGNSMVNAGIHSNDILIVDRALSPAHNKIAIVRINDEFTVKRIKLDAEKTFLVAENNQYQPIQITQDMDCEVWGIVTFVIHQV